MNTQHIIPFVHLQRTLITDYYTLYDQSTPQPGDLYLALQAESTSWLELVLQSTILEQDGPEDPLQCPHSVRFGLASFTLSTGT